MTIARFSLSTLLALAVGLASFAAQGSGREDYRLGSGDVLEIAVYGVADFTRRATVNIDGNVAVPLLGQVSASGLSIEDLRADVAGRLAEVGAFRDPHVTVELIEHRPFYVSGDVARPGAHPFRPGLTARHAVALSGGYDALRYRPENPLLAVPEMQSRYETLWIDLVARQARVLGLQAELDGADTVDLAVLYDAPLARRSIEEMVALENRGLRLRLQDHEAEMEHLKRAVDQGARAVSTLEQFVAQQDASLELQTAASERAQEQSARGITTTLRVEEERRALAMLRGQHMDALARLTVARREHEESRRRLARIDGERQERLLRELIGATAELEQIRAQLKGAGERLIYMGGLRSQLQRDGSGPELTLFRDRSGSAERIPATEDTPLQPGDVLEVTVRPEQLVVAPGH